MTVLAPPASLRLRIFLLVAAGLAALARPAPVRADARSDARAKLVEGGEFLKRGQFEEALARSAGKRPKVIILRLSRVPLIDSSGIAALKTFIDSAKGHGATVILSGARPKVREMLDRMKVAAFRAENYPSALARALAELQLA